MYVSEQKVQGRRKFPLTFFLNMEKLVLVLGFFCIFKGNHYCLSAWRLAGLLRLGPCCLRQLSHFWYFFVVFMLMAYSKKKNVSTFL